MLEKRQTFFVCFALLFKDKTKAKEASSNRCFDGRNVQNYH